MKNIEAVELFNLLNGLLTVPGSHLEYATMKTLRKMKRWQTHHAEKLAEIDDDNCATHVDKGTTLMMKETLKRNKDGAVEEYRVNCYTPEGEKKRLKERKAFNEQEVEDQYKFEIHKTSDGKELSQYHKFALEELGFYVPKNDKEPEQ